MPQTIVYTNRKLFVKFDVHNNTHFIKNIEIEFAVDCIAPLQSSLIVICFSPYHLNGRSPL